MARTEEQVKGSVATALASYLDGPDGDAGPGQFGSSLAAFIGLLLAGDERWSSHWWVDDVLSERLDRLSRDTARLTGVAITADERHQWIEPFRAILRLARSRDRLASYQVSVGDADVGLATVSYGGRRPKTWPEPPSWVFMFGQEGDQRHD